VPRRDLVHRRSPFVRWTGRLLALLGTGAVLAAGVVVGSMVLAAVDDDDAVDASPAARSGAGGVAGGLTRQQREERRAAVAEVRERGYAPQDLADYEIDHLLRVIVGEPVGDTPPGMRAFFFVDGEYVGRDARKPSGKLRPGRQLEREITIVYTLYEDGDRACCPSGEDERVHFRWDGERLVPRERIPPAAQRLPPG
jgi:hypothetical protein